MKKKMSLILVLLFLVPSFAFAADDVPASVTAVSAADMEKASAADMEKVLANIKNIKFGGEVRFRGYEMNNFWSFYDNSSSYKYKYSGIDDRWSVFRLRSQLYFSADVGDNVTGYIRLANQTYGEGVSDYEDNKSNKVFIDNAYVDVKSFMGVPFDLKLGRQNLMYGSGFVVFDGQSQFASTSMYFDGVKGTVNFSDQIKLDMFYMIDQENDRGNKSSDYYSYGYHGDDIYLYGAYLTVNNAFLSGQQELYAMSKKSQEIGRNIKTFGLRLSDKFDFGLDYSLEVAKQFGTARDYGYMKEDHDALGGKADVGFTFNGLALKPRLFGQFAYMSGDDDDTDDTCEEWDVFYGGWPQFGDLLAWTFVNIPPNGIVGYDSTYQTGEAAYRNLQLFTVGASFSTGVISPRISYTKIKAAETEAYWFDDDDLGDYYQASVGYQYSKALSFGLYYAVIMPGDEYKDYGQDDNAYEFFWETKVKF